MKISKGFNFLNLTSFFSAHNISNFRCGKNRENEKKILDELFKDYDACIPPTGDGETGNTTYSLGNPYS